jgi:hypothetical protein
MTDTRVGFVRNTIDAAVAYMPFGSGVGTFVPVYGMFERPEDALINAYANHAHNDLVEAWLESGILGAVLMLLFAVWLTWRSVSIWRRGPPPGARTIDWSLARAATIIVALVGLHSLVDYPLRTAAMMAIMAFACALLIEPVTAGEASEPAEPARRPEKARLPERARPVAAPSRTAIPAWPGGLSPLTSPTAPAGQDLGIEWPEAWRRLPQR